MPSLHYLQEGNGGQQKDESGTDELGEHNKASLVQLIGNNTPKKVKQDGGHGVGKPNIPQVQWRVIELVDQPKKAKL